VKPTWAETIPDFESSCQVDDLVIYPSRRIVLRGDAELPLGKLTFDLLLLVVESAPDLVSHDLLARKLWAGRVVSDETVRQRIKLLRKALGDDSTNPRYFNVIRGQGIRLIPPVTGVPAPDTGRAGLQRIALASITATIALATIMYLFWPADLEPQTGTAHSDRSLAVLPFESLSSEPADAYFVDGFHNDLLTQLARIGDLKVISRTSVLEYRNDGRNLRQIGRELGVDSILEGSIQRSGDSVRINAQLIDARDDHHLWAEVYDREVTGDNLFDVQAEMADAITSAMQIQLSAQESRRIHDRPTASAKAYNAYLLGRRYLEESTVFENHKAAIDAFRMAVSEDPDFALAWAELAHAHSALFFFRDRSSDHRESARVAVERALSLRPDLPEAHLALGFFRYHAEGDYEGALAAWEIAERGMPGDHRLYHARAVVYARMGESDRSVQNWERAVELDPRNAGKHISMAWQLALLGDYERSRSALEKAVALVPDKPVGYERLAYLSLWRDGDGNALRKALHAAPFSVRAFPMEWLAAVYERDYDAAFALLDQWAAEAVDTPLVYRPKEWFYATTSKFRGDPDGAGKQFRLARTKLEDQLASRPDDVRLKITLADVLANLGDREKAIVITNEVLSELPTSLDASRGPNIRLAAVQVYLAAGDYDSAIDHLEAYLSSPSVWAIEGLLPDPRFDPVRQDPRFLELVRRHRRS